MNAGSALASSVAICCMVVASYNWRPLAYNFFQRGDDAVLMHAAPCHGRPRRQILFVHLCECKNSKAVCHSLVTSFAAKSGRLQGLIPPNRFLCAMIWSPLYFLITDAASSARIAESPKFKTSDVFIAAEMLLVKNLYGSDVEIELNHVMIDTACVYQ
jgi:hypothetical protein